MKKHLLPLGRTRQVIVCCVLFLTAAGFFTEWLVQDKSIFDLIPKTLLPMVPALLVYLTEQRTRFLEKTLTGIKNAKMLNVALPILFGSVGCMLDARRLDLSVYFTVCFLICVCVNEATLYHKLDDYLSAMMMNTVVFLGMTLLMEHAVAAAFIVGFSYLLAARVAISHPDTEKSFGGLLKSFFAWIVLLLFLSVLIDEILELLEYRFLCNETVCFYLDSFQNLLRNGKWFGMARDFWDSAFELRRRFVLGYLAGRYGWISITPILLALLTLLLAGLRMCFTYTRKLTTLAFCAYCLLFLRIAAYFLAILGSDYRIADGLPFFQGSFGQRVFDLLLVVILLQPLCPPKLAELDPKDADYEALEMASLIMLPYNLDGLAQLCRYVFDDSSKHLAWGLLFKEYIPLMDINTLRIMVLNADSLFRTQYFRETYPAFFSFAGDPEHGDIPEEMQTLCCDNTFLDSNTDCNASGTMLTRYWGNREILLIPPFYRRIGVEAFATNRKLKAVSIPHTVRRICFSAFQDCENLEVLELRNGLEEIGPYAFASTALKEIFLPDSVQRIENDAFAESSLTCAFIPGSVQDISEYTFYNIPTLQTVTLCDGVRTIGTGAFLNCCNLAEIYIPDSVSFIAPNAFEGCNALQKIHVSDAWKEKYPDLLRLLLSAQNDSAEK